MPALRRLERRNIELSACAARKRSSNASSPRPRLRSSTACRPPSLVSAAAEVSRGGLGQGAWRGKLSFGSLRAGGTADAVRRPGGRIAGREAVIGGALDLVGDRVLATLARSACHARHGIAVVAGIYAERAIEVAAAGQRPLDQQRAADGEERAERRRARHAIAQQHGAAERRGDALQLTDVLRIGALCIRHGTISPREDGAVSTKRRRAGQGSAFAALSQAPLGIRGAAA